MGKDRWTTMRRSPKEERTGPLFFSPATAALKRACDELRFYFKADKGDKEDTIGHYVLFTWARLSTVAAHGSVRVPRGW